MLYQSIIFALYIKKSKIFLPIKENVLVQRNI